MSGCSSLAQWASGRLFPLTNSVIFSAIEKRKALQFQSVYGVGRRARGSVICPLGSAKRDHFIGIMTLFATVIVIYDIGLIDFHSGERERDVSNCYVGDVWVCTVMRSTTDALNSPCISRKLQNSFPTPLKYQGHQVRSSIVNTVITHYLLGPGLSLGGMTDLSTGYDLTLRTRWDAFIWIVVTMAEFATMQKIARVSQTLLCERLNDRQ
jgi:hypothetical protein